MKVVLLLALVGAAFSIPLKSKFQKLVVKVCLIKCNMYRKFLVNFISNIAVLLEQNVFMCTKKNSKKSKNKNINIKIMLTIFV